MKSGRKREFDKYILEVFQQHKLSRLRFNEILGYLKDAGHKTNDRTLKRNLDYLGKEGLVWKFSGGRYCLVKYAGMIAINETMSMLRSLRDKCEVDSKNWNVRLSALYLYARSLGQTKKLTEWEITKAKEIIASGQVKGIEYFNVGGEEIRNEQEKAGNKD